MPGLTELARSDGRTPDLYLQCLRLALELLGRDRVRQEFPNDPPMTSNLSDVRSNSRIKNIINAKYLLISLIQSGLGERANAFQSAEEAACHASLQPILPRACMQGMLHI